jgi:hypothetical protein
VVAVGDFTSNWARRRTDTHLRLALLGGVSLIAWGIVVVRAPSAHAEQDPTSTASTVNSDGTGIYVAPNVDLTGSPGISNDTATGTVYSQGTIESGGSGVENSSTISVLTNDSGGTITGHGNGFYSYGVYSSAGSIGTLDNKGLISATGTNALGVYNQRGAIGLLTNSGTISSAYAIVNGTTATIGTLINTGTIRGYTSGIDNYGLINTLTNSGNIDAPTSGIYNKGQIHTLTNSGTISGEYGIVTGDYEGTTIGTIGAIYNTGTVLGTTGGLVNGGTIGTIINSVLIYGGTIGVGSSGYIGTLANLSGGTIAGYEVGAGSSGTIIDFTNAGLIESTATDAATIAGFVNIGTIVSFTNQSGGLITSLETGIINGGEISTLTNNGAIIADYAIGNQYDGTIAGIVNTSAIRGYYTGLYNDGEITALTNSGTIYGEYDGALYNEGYIGTITNLFGGTIEGHYDGIGNNGEIAGITNSGLIASTDYDEAIYDGYDATLGALTNLATGTLSGASTGVFNEGTIGILTNAGVIEGGYYGLYNYALDSYPTIATINNSGTITGGDDGIFNQGLALYSAPNLLAAAETTSRGDLGAIGAITNTGLIAGSTGIYNEGTIGAIANSGTITGNYAGIYNSGALYTYYDDYAARTEVAPATTGYLTGTITSLTNSGVISGGSTGIRNEGTIGAISNSGTITGGIYGIYNGVENPKVSAVRTLSTTTSSVPAIIGQITNSGTISGITGIYLTGGGTTITNSGTIASTNGGNAIFFSGDNDLVLTTGSVIDGTIDGGGTASQIALQGNGSLDTTIAEFGAGSALAVTPGADWTATGNWTIADVVNDGVFQPGRIGTPLTLTGDYLQNADGTMRVLVTPTTSTEFHITGTATLAGTVSYVLAPGRYSPHVYPYLTATGGVPTEFTTVNYGEIPKGLAATQYLEDPTVELVLTGSFDIPNIVNPADSTIFSAQTQALAQEADADTGALLEKATEGGAATSPACAAEAPLSPQKTGSPGSNAALASTLASVFCGAGGWVEATGSLGHADPSGGAPSYNANTAGFLAGVDKVLDPTGTRLGFAVGYDETYLSDKLGGGGRMGTTRVALYGAQPVGMFTLAGVLEYGNANNSTSRASGDGNLSENNSVSIWSGGLQLSTQMMMHGIDFLPAAGLRVASVGGGSHFAEGGSGLAAAFAVSGKTTQYNSVQPYVLLEGKQNFYTASGITVTPDAEIGYEYEAGTHGVVTTLVDADGTVFYTPHNDLDPSDALLSAGVAAGKNNWSVYATYTAHVSGNWDTQIGEAGLRITF